MKLFNLNPSFSPSQRPKGNYPCIPEALLRNSIDNTATTCQWSLKGKQISNIKNIHCPTIPFLKI